MRAAPISQTLDPSQRARTSDDRDDGREARRGRDDGDADAVRATLTEDDDGNMLADGEELAPAAAGRGVAMLAMSTVIVVETRAGTKKRRWGHSRDCSALVAG